MAPAAGDAAEDSAVPLATPSDGVTAAAPDAAAPVARPDGPFVDATHQIVSNGCPSERFPADALLGSGALCTSPGAGCGPGLQCLGPWDCTKGEFGRCVGSASSACEYAGVRASEGCDDDADCLNAPQGRCRTFIAFSVCQYVDQCESASDCAAGERCECGLSGTVCVEAECFDAADCPTGQRCQRALDACRFPYGGYFCSTDLDACRADADCDRGRCNFDRALRHWVCDAAPSCTIP